MIFDWIKFYITTITIIIIIIIIIINLDDVKPWLSWCDQVLYHAGRL